MALSWPIEPGDVIVNSNLRFVGLVVCAGIPYLSGRTVVQTCDILMSAMYLQDVRLYGTDNFLTLARA
jgi:hypothetical protein